MTTSAVLFVTVCGIATVNSLLLAGYLLRTARGERRLNQLLAALILTFSVRVAKAVALLFLDHLHPVFELAWLAALGSTGVPALFYAHHLIGRQPGITRRALAAFGSGVVVAALVLIFPPLPGGWPLMGASLAVYAAGVGLAVRLAASWWRDQPAADRLSRIWLSSILLFLVVVWLIHASLVASRFAGPVDEEAFFNLEAVLFSVAVYALVYLELRYGLIGRLHQPGGRDRVDPDDPMLKRLRHAMEDERLFLDPSLTLQSLARTLKLSPQHVSKLINAGVGSSFNDYVNRLRIEEACRILAGPDGPSRKIGALAYDCGFGSPSVFYAAFRKFTGKRPSEYQKSLARG